MLAVVEDNEAKVGCHHSHVTTGKGDVVNGLGGCQASILDVAYIIYLPAFYINDINVRIGVCNHHIMLCGVIVDVAHTSVVEVVSATKVLILLCFLVIAEERSAH